MSSYTYTSHPSRRKSNGRMQSITIHSKIWIEKHGEIPKGYIIHHIDKNKKNNNINNLQMVTRSEHTILHPKRKNIIKKKRFLRKWICPNKCEELLHGDSSIKKIFCRCGKQMIVISKIRLNKTGQDIA